MGLSERTQMKLRAESEAAGGKIYEDDQEPNEEDITRFEEDDDPQALAGDPVDETSDNEEGKV